jgi:hypothetical protein
MLIYNKIVLTRSIAERGLPLFQCIRVTDITSEHCPGKSNHSSINLTRTAYEQVEGTYPFIEVMNVVQNFLTSFMHCDITNKNGLIVRESFLNE